MRNRLGEHTTYNDLLARYGTCGRCSHQDEMMKPQRSGALCELIAYNLERIKLQSDIFLETEESVNEDVALSAMRYTSTFNADENRGNLDVGPSSRRA